VHGLRLVVYNIRYATGTGPAFHLPLPGAGYLRSNRRVLAGLTEFLRAQNADVIGLIEVDTGSVRSGMVNQAAHIAGSLGHFSSYQCKYGTSSMNNFLPIVRKQANAFLAAPHATEVVRRQEARIAMAAPNAIGSPYESVHVSYLRLSLR
jgi:hypothetical protein